MWALRDFGNFVNGQETEARSFSLESLSSLTTTKSFVDPAVSLLDTFVEFIKHDHGDLLEFHEEIDQVYLCCNAPVSAMQAEMQQLREGHRLAVSLAEAASTTSTPPEAAKETARSRTAFAEFANGVDIYLGVAQRFLDDLELSKQRFRRKYEEDKESLLEQNLSTLARFVFEFRRAPPRPSGLRHVSNVPLLSN